MTYVFDTNIIIAALNGYRPIVERLNLVHSTEAVLPAMVLAELRYGALSSQRVAENLLRIERLLDRVTLAPVDRAVAECFGSIKTNLRQLGVTKSDADLLIAATALELKSPLVTDDSDLLDGRIASLTTENWPGSGAQRTV